MGIDNACNFAFALVGLSHEVQFDYFSRTAQDRLRMIAPTATAPRGLSLPRPSIPASLVGDVLAPIVNAAPTVPATPSTPATHATPATPVIHATPATPATPAIPVAPDTPATPVPQIFEPTASLNGTGQTTPGEQIPRPLADLSIPPPPFAIAATVIKITEPNGRCTEFKLTEGDTFNAHVVAESNRSLMDVSVTKNPALLNGTGSFN